MEREGRRLNDEIKMMEDVEVRKDEEIAAVAMQIRATLAKVCLQCAVMYSSYLFIVFSHIRLKIN